MDQLIKALGISGPTLIAQLINFVILLGLLYLFAYKPIMKMLDQRSKKIAQSMEQTEYIQQQAAEADKEYEKRLEAASRESQEAIARANRAGDELRQRSQQEAREEAETLIGRARTAIQRERDEAIDDLRREFADLTIMAAEKVIGRSLDKQTHRELIEKTLEESTGLKKN